MRTTGLFIVLELDSHGWLPDCELKSFLRSYGRPSKSQCELNGEYIVAIQKMSDVTHIYARKVGLELFSLHSER